MELTGGLSTIDWVSNGMPLSRALRHPTIWLSFAAFWWLLTFLISRATIPAVRTWTEPCFGAGLALSYLAVWAVVVAWSHSSPRRVLLRALATTGTLTLLLVLVELPATVRLISYAPLLEQTGITDAFVADVELSFRRPANVTWTGQVQGDVVSGWNLPPETTKRVTFTTDALGFRNRQSHEQADVVLLGDSYVEGWYVSDEETAAVVLEQRLGRPVSNLGVSGFGTLQELAVLRRYGLPLRPRLVAWFFFEGNDLYDDQEFENALIYLREHGVYDTGPVEPARFEWSRFQRASFVRNAYGLLRRTIHPLVRQALPPHGSYRDGTGAMHRLYYHNYAALPFTDYERERFETTTTAFLERVTLARGQGVMITLFFVPMKFRVYGEFCTFAPDSPCRHWQPWALPTRFAALCAEEDLDCVDLSEPMRAAAEAGQLLYATEDSHWNAAGHAFVAEQVLAVWRRLGYEPSGNDGQ